MATWSAPFRELCCETLGWSENSYAERVFWNCLYPHAIPIAFAWGTSSRIFAEDFQSIEQLGLARSDSEFRREISDFRYSLVREAWFARKNLRLRLSVKRLARLKAKVLTP